MKCLWLGIAIDDSLRLQEIFVSAAELEILYNRRSVVILGHPQIRAIHIGSGQDVPTNLISLVKIYIGRQSKKFLAM